MADQPDTLASSAGHAQQGVDNDAAALALAPRLASTQHRTNSGVDNDVTIASGAAAPARSLLLGLQALTKLYPPDDSSKAAHSGSSFVQYCMPSNNAHRNTSLKWCSGLPNRQADKPSSMHTSKHASDISSSALRTHQQPQQLALPQQAAAAWKPPKSNTAAADTAVTCTPISHTVSNSSSVTCGNHSASRPLQLHKQQERDRNMGVLLMERRLAKLSAALEEAQALQEQYAQQLEDANAAHKQRLGNVQVGGAEEWHCCLLPTKDRNTKFAIVPASAAGNGAKGCIKLMC
jgi:hypothetical protein